VQNFTEIVQSAAELWPGFKIAAVRHLKFKKMLFWSSGYHRVPNVLLSTTFHQNQIIFFRGDMAI